MEKRRTYVWYDEVATFYEGLAEVSNMQRSFTEHAASFHTVEVRNIWKEYTTDYFRMDGFYRQFHLAYERYLCIENPCRLWYISVKFSGMGVVRLKERGGQAELRRGCTDGGQCTVVEFASRMMSHVAQLKLNPQNRVVMCCHSANLPAMTDGRDPDERPSPVPSGRCAPACIVVAPEGADVRLRMLCCIYEISKRLLRRCEPLSRWPGAGTKDMDASFSLIETAEIDMTIPIRR